MKVAILAGGRGSRLAEETRSRPKPMVEIGGMPILWHIMMHYRGFGHRDFVVALGYKGQVIRDWVASGAAASSRLGPDARIELVDTGAETDTGGRIKALAPQIGAERFMLTWGDGVADVDLDALLAFHKGHGKLATLTAVRPPPRFGHLTLEGDRIVDFREKPPATEGWINGAFFVLEPEVLDLIDGPACHFESAVLPRLARDGQLMAFRHHGFWQCMDTVHDKQRLDALWATGNAPWATWDAGQCVS